MTELLADVLRYPLFAALDRERIEHWVSVASIRRFAAGETLAHRGDTLTHLFLIETGRVRILQTTVGREISLGTCLPTNIVGDHALLPPHTLRSSLRAAAETTVHLLPVAPLQEMITPHKNVALNRRAWLRLQHGVRFLRNESYLGFMSPESFLPLLDRCPEVFIRRGNTIQTDGLATDSFFLVRSGQVLLVSESSSALGPPRVLGPGDGFGAEVLAGQPLAGSAVAVEDCNLVRVPHAAFLDRPIGDAINQTLTHVSAPPVVYPWVGQKTAEECGPASLAMVTQFYGISVTCNDIRGHFSLDARGASAFTMCEVANTLGFRASAVRVGAEAWTELVLPAIAHLSDGHYVVVYASAAESITIGDPARGIVQLHRPDFFRVWSGVAILLRPKLPRPTSSPMPEVNSQQFSLLVGRLKAGDEAAREELIRAALNRLERLTRKMLRGFPSVKRWEETGDVLQNSLIRLDRALRVSAPESSRAFFGLAAEQIRRELLDLVRHYQGPHGLGRNCRTGGFTSEKDEIGPREPPDTAPAQGDLERWTELHEAVAQLPVEEREVFMLTFYHGWTQIQIAELFQVDERTVRRRWRAATVQLHNALGGNLPDTKKDSSQ